MAKIMMGLATLFIGERMMCEAIAQTMQDKGEQVRVADLQAGENVFDIL